MLYGRYIVPVFLAATIMFMIFLFFIVMYVLIHRKRKHEAAARLARLNFEHRNQLLLTKLNEQEHAMTCISREIHDNVSQQTDLLMMYLKAADEAETESERRNMLGTGKIILSNISNDLRNASYSLNGDYIKRHGLHEVLQKALDYIQRTKLMSCGLHVEGRYRSMAPETELLIFRIAQEALRNTIKYAQASRLEVNLRYQPAAFIMEISDNGVGFCLRALHRKPQTLGFQNMSQRAELLHAALDVDTAPGEGCKVILTLKTDTPAGS